jgi:RNA polymerase sigma factor (sigma-70 family)
LRGEARSVLRAAIRVLPPDQARAIVMAGVYRMSAREVAESEGIPLGTAKTRIRAALKKLKVALALEQRNDG